MPLQYSQRGNPFVCFFKDSFYSVSFGFHDVCSVCKPLEAAFSKAAASKKYQLISRQ